MNWKSIIATALVTGVVTIITGVALFWWQTDKQELTYNSIQSIPFDDVSNSVFIQQIEIENSGDKPVEDVVLVISFTDEIIQKSKISINKAISHTQEIEDKLIRLKIDNLNHREGANVSVLYQCTKSNSIGAVISLRGKGVTGKLIGSTKKNNKEPIWIALIAAYAGVFAFLLSTKRGRLMLPLIAKGLFLNRSLSFLGRNQKNEIASALSMYGYPEKAKEYLSAGVDRQYWVEADLLAAEAILGNGKLKNDTIKILSLIIKVPNIARTSEAIAYYNIARLFKVLKSNDSKIEEYLTLAKKLDNLEIESRLSRDPVFLEV